jgi:hypothetical protein
MKFEFFTPPHELAAREWFEEEKEKEKEKQFFGLRGFFMK